VNRPTLNAGDGRNALLLGHRYAGPFLVTHKRYTTQFRQTWHEHPAASIDFVLEGGGVGVYGGATVESHAGTVEYFRHEVRHDFRSAPGGIRSMHLVIPAELVDRRTRMTVVRELEPTRALGLAAGLLAELTDPDASSNLAMEALARELLAEVVPAARAPERGTRPPRWLIAARDALHDHRSEPLGLSGLADAVGVNPGHLARAFRRRHGCSPGEYHRRLRLSHAARRLASTRDSLARVALDAGFHDQAHFTRAFRSHVGVTPARFRMALGS